MFLDLDTIKNYLGIPLINTDYDDFLNMQGEIVTQAIEGYCGRVFMAGNYVQVFHADELRKYALKEMFTYHFPINSITSIQLDDQVAITDSDEIKAYLRWASDQGVLRKVDGMWFRDIDKFTITYNAGYSTLPAPVKHTYLSIIEGNYNKKANGVDINFGRDVQRISIPGALSIDFDYTLDANERKNSFGAILNGYLNILDFYRSERVLNGEIGRFYND